MIGVDAFLVVATMADIQAFGNGAKVYFPRNTVRILSLRPITYLAVSIGGHRTFPKPTLIECFGINVTPKPLPDWKNLTSMARNIMHWLAFGMSKTLTCFFGYRCLLTAATLTIAVWDFLRGIIGVHRKRLLSVSKPGAIPVAARHFCVFVQE